MNLAICAIGLLPSAGIAQQAAERFWLAGRYDRNHVVVYFEALQLKHTIPRDSGRIPPPIADAFFSPVAVPPEYVARFQKAGMEQFKIGDRYDLLLGDGRVVTVTLTTLVACETDEDVGNDSYIGALARVETADTALLARRYFALRRHQPPGARAADANVARARLDSQREDPVLTARLATLLQQTLDADSAQRVQRRSQLLPVSIDRAQSFVLADGTLRQFVNARFATGEECGTTAFVNPGPPARVLAQETRYCLHNAEGPALMNVVDLGHGRTGLIFDIFTGAGRELKLVEYADGLSLRALKILHEIAAGE